jgi:Bacteriophage HK97-gp10, putative tail-component
MASEGFTGMAALIRDLERMGDDVQQEAGAVVEDTAERMAASVIQSYPRGDGALRAGVVVEESARRDTARTPLRWKVRSKAKHAHLFEFGTVRRYTAGTGANRGVMEDKPTFIPAAVRARAGMVDRLTRVVQAVRVKGMTGRP